MLLLRKLLLKHPHHPGLGGCLDVFSGEVQRAPEIFQRLGLEWFYRLCKNPSRAGRMMKLPLFLVHVQREKRRK